MFSFNSPASILEIFWEITLLVFIIRVAVIYCITTLVTCLYLGFIRSHGFVTPFHSFYSHEDNIDLLQMVITMGVSLLWARWVIAANEIPPNSHVRLLFGGISLAIMFLTEIGLDKFEYIEGWDVWESGGSWRFYLGFMIVLVLHGLMPLVLMIFENTTDTSKSITKQIDSQDSEEGRENTQTAEVF